MDQPVNPAVDAGVIPVVVPTPAVAAPAETLCSIDELKRFRFIVARILEAAVHPNADKLFVIKVDTGAGIRQVVAGIRRSYSPETLVGRQVIMVVNLQPAVIRGVESQGMLLAASDDQGVSLLAPDRAVAPGSIVK